MSSREGRLETPCDEASYFAECLLMPQSAVLRLWPTVRLHPDSVNLMCKIFGVPYNVMCNRLRDLELL